MKAMTSPKLRLFSVRERPVVKSESFQNKLNGILVREEFDALSLGRLKNCKIPLIGVNKNYH